jgi:glycerol-3-phosphate dehydrogenase
MRGAKVLLLEKGDLCAGASGGNHGMLHSGARYAVKDPGSARECAVESDVLRNIAPGCIEDTGGLFIRLEQDEEDYQQRFENGCRSAGIKLERMDRQDIFSLEPCLTTNIESGFSVPDGSIDPFRLVLENVGSARRSGAIVKNYCPVTEMTRADGRIVEIIYQDRRNGEKHRVQADVVVNAAGAWADEVAQLAGCDLHLIRDYGALLVFNGRSVDRLINRLRPPSDGDIIVPNHTSMIVGTTSRQLKRGEEARPDATEIERLHRDAIEMVPELRCCRLIRSYGGIRPLAAAGGRGSSRSYRLVEHEAEGVGNLISIIGGKLTTYRSMAEAASDAAARMIGLRASCRTAIEPLSDHRGPVETSTLTFSQKLSFEHRYGGVPVSMLGDASSKRSSVQSCSCEQVMRFELDHYARSEDVRGISDLMRRTRAGMGYCQGVSCTWEMLASLASRPELDPKEMLRSFLEERGRGLEPILSGDQLRQEIFRVHLLVEDSSEDQEVKR